MNYVIKFCEYLNKFGRDFIKKGRLIRSKISTNGAGSNFDSIRLVAIYVETQKVKVKAKSKKSLSILKSLRQNESQFEMSEVKNRVKRRNLM